MFLCGTHGFAADAPPSPARPWIPLDNEGLHNDARTIRTPGAPIDPDRSYSLAELIDLAEAYNPETRLAWERARAQAAPLGVARSELYPFLAATALSRATRYQNFSGTTIDRRRTGDFDGGLELSYIVFDFGARSGRISAANAELLAANFFFNDAHRRVIYQVQQAYFQLLNSAGQLTAAQTSLTNAQTVQQAAEDRLQNGLATVPDVLQARSATAQAQYELQSIVGAQEIAQGNLGKALGNPPTIPVQVQPLERFAIPDTLADTIDDGLNRALAQRPDLMRKLAEVRAANARVKVAHAAYYPIVSLGAAAGGQALYGSQDSGPWIHKGDFVGGAGISLTWPLFDGGARKSKLEGAKADARASEAGVNVARDAIAEEVWRAYSNLRTAFRQRQSSLALLSAAEQSYLAALESYNHGVRNLLDVTAAQRTLAQARSTDVLARTQVLVSLAELAFRTGDSIQPAARKAER
jgi:outer membrane protein TolC